MFFRIILISVLSLVSFSGIFAAWDCANQWKITDTSFKINLGCMDPINNGSSIEWKGSEGIIQTLLTSFSELLLFTIPIIAVVSFLIAWYFYIFSAGDSEKVNRAKTIIKWNVLAIIVALLSYGIVRLIAWFFA
jgi:hypothetical protein